MAAFLRLRGFPEKLKERGKYAHQRPDPLLPASAAQGIYCRTENILLLPARHNKIVLNFGKHAMKTIGRHEKKQTISRNPDRSTYRMRVENEYIIIENVQI